MLLIRIKYLFRDDCTFSNFKQYCKFDFFKINIFYQKTSVNFLLVNFDF